jgi:hypothetical protein
MLGNFSSDEVGMLSMHPVDDKLPCEVRKFGLSVLRTERHYGKIRDVRDMLTPYVMRKRGYATWINLYLQ